MEKMEVMEVTEVMEVMEVMELMVDQFKSLPYSSLALCRNKK